MSGETFEFGCEIDHIEFGIVDIQIEARIISWGEPATRWDPHDGIEWETTKMYLDVGKDDLRSGATLHQKSLTDDNWNKVNQFGDEASCDVEQDFGPEYNKEDELED